MRTGRWALVIGMILVAAPATVRADAKSDARALVQDGARLYEKGDFTGALAQFDKAYAKFATAIIQFNRGQALHSLGRPVEAIDAVERFLKEAIDAPVDRLRDAQQMLQELHRQVGSLQISSNVDGAAVLIDGTQVGTTPLPKAVMLKPGAHKVAVQKIGMIEFTRSVDLAPGGRLNVDAHLAAPEPTVVVADAGRTPPPAPAPSTPAATVTAGAAPSSGGEPRSMQRTIGLVLTAAGIAGLAVGGIYGWLTFSTNDQAEEVCAGMTTCTNPMDITRHAQLVAEAKRYETRSIVGFVAGGALFATGVVVMLTAPSSPSRSSVHLTPIGGIGIAGLGIEGIW